MSNLYKEIAGLLIDSDHALTIVNALDSAMKQGRSQVFVEARKLLDVQQKAAMAIDTRHCYEVLEAVVNYVSNLANNVTEEWG